MNDLDGNTSDPFQTVFEMGMFIGILIGGLVGCLLGLIIANL